MNGLGSAHIRIARPTNNIDGLLPFYVDGLGMSVIFRFGAHEGFDGAMVGWKAADSAGRSLSASGVAYHLEFTSKEGHDAGRAPSQDNLLVFYEPDEEAHDAAIQRMIKAGFAPVQAFNPYWDRNGKTFEDPDGYRVVLAKQQSPF
ncbi:hypothetical protein SEPCBS119000_002150 [Sporothrix epigloea]|uniref:VOC domain-containing protein n=1 Tax=Sporothrix epigloea TaxID=1892477 RepID=A0ABP0DEN2_9PEZI